MALRSIRAMSTLSCVVGRSSRGRWRFTKKADNHLTKWRRTAMSSEDDVGYGRPPQATRFKPGQSGNPRGRPKGSVNLGTALNRTMRERIVIVEQGRRKTISKAEAIAKQAANRAVS